MDAGPPPSPDAAAESSIPGHVERFLRDPRALNIPWCDSPFLERQLAELQVQPERAEQVRAFARDGYLILEDAVEPELIDRVLADYPRLFDPHTDFGADSGFDEPLRRDPKRRQDAWRVNADIRELACHPTLLDTLRLLYQREPIPFQTLNFLPGTQQTTHSDAMHFSCFPKGFMCGVWVALEDVTEANGPLRYYPGSHRLPEIGLETLGLHPEPDTWELGPNYEQYEDYVRAVIDAAGLREEHLTVKKGTALVWSHNLLHGGTAIRDPSSTRKSQVTHYYFEDCVYFGPIHSEIGLGELRLRHVHDLLRDRDVPHTLNGKPLEACPMGNGNHRLGLPGSGLFASRAGARDLRGAVAADTLTLLHEQVTAILAAERLDPVERAMALARLGEVALRAAEQADGGRAGS